MATFGHITPERCAQLAEELTNAFLRWEEIGRRDAPQYLTYRVTDPYGRLWSIGPATRSRPRSQRVCGRPDAPDRSTKRRSCPPARSWPASGISPRERPVAAVAP